MNHLKDLPCACLGLSEARKNLKLLRQVQKQQEKGLSAKEDTSAQAPNEEGSAAVGIGSTDSNMLSVDSNATGNTGSSSGRKGGDDSSLYMGDILKDFDKVYQYIEESYGKKREKTMTKTGRKMKRMLDKFEDKLAADHMAKALGTREPLPVGRSKKPVNISSRSMSLRQRAASRASRGSSTRFAGERRDSKQSIDSNSISLFSEDVSTLPPRPMSNFLSERTQTNKSIGAQSKLTEGAQSEVGSDVKDQERSIHRRRTILKNMSMASRDQVPDVYDDPTSTDGVANWTDGDRMAEEGRIGIICDHFNDLKFTSKTLDYTAWKGQMDTLQFLHKIIPKKAKACTTDAMDLASREGHLEVLEWLENYRNEGCTEMAVDYAAEFGRLDALKLLFDRTRVKGTTDAIDRAAENGHLDVVKWLIQKRRNFTTRAMDMAAMNGHIEIVKLLHGVPRSVGCTHLAVDACCKRGDLNMLQWFRDNRPTHVVTARGMKWAAEANHVELFHWFKKNKIEQVPYSIRVSIRAAMMHGHLPLVTWMYRQYTPWFDLSEKDFGLMIESGHAHIASWLHKTFPSLKFPPETLMTATQRGHSEVVMWAMEHREEAWPLVVPIGKLARRLGHYDIYHFLLDKLETPALTEEMPNYVPR